MEQRLTTTPTTFTIAEYCDQVANGSIIVNEKYQRSNKVWPSSARSYLIDTILSGYPIPKISLYQKLDLPTRKTIKEIVDGQQRTNAIMAFYKDELKISGRSDYEGMTYSALEPAEQRVFLSYPLTTDIFSAASPDDIREVFRRINSYTIPLNKQEHRHATYQGEFKWFIGSLLKDYTQSLIDCGAMTERSVSRMADAAFFTEFVAALELGIFSARESILDSMYKKYDKSYSEMVYHESRIAAAFVVLYDLRDFYSTKLMKQYSLFTLLLAISHNQLACDQKKLASIT